MTGNSIYARVVSLESSAGFGHTSGVLVTGTGRTGVIHFAVLFGSSRLVHNIAVGAHTEEAIGGPVFGYFRNAVSGVT